MKEKRKVSNWYAGLMWNFTIVVMGGILTSIVCTAPFLLSWHLLFGLRVHPSWTCLRTLQIVQIVLVYLLGGAFTRWYFPRQFQFDLKGTQVWVHRTVWVPIFFVGGTAIGAAVATYGQFNAVMVVSVILIGATDVVCCLCSTRYFFQSLCDETNSRPQEPVE